jgi:predicted outer membrane repeat protein
MNKLNKLALKVFSVLLSVMLLNIPTFANGRFQTITNDSGTFVDYKHRQLNNYVEDTGGGGVFLLLGSQLYISDCIFENNSAQLDGGVIKVDNPATYLNISSSSFSSNTSNTDGGAISIYSQTNIIFEKNVTFKNNTAKSQAGAIYNNGNTNIGINMEFIGNKAGTYGGAICNKNFFTIGNNVFFSSNTSSDWGGAIYNVINSTFTIGDGANFNKNSAGNNGGTIYNSGCFTIGNNVLFSSNTSSSWGGAIYNDGKFVFTIGDGAKFDYNTAGSAGGAIYTYGDMSFGMNAEFSKNSTSSAGGAIYISDGSVTIGDGAKFNENSIKYRGGAIYNNGNLTIGNNVIFSSNTATLQSGGAICSGVNSVITIGDGAKFNYNTASASGAIDNYGILNVGINAEFSKNTATSSGGVMYISSGSVTIGDGAKFNYNTAGIAGGTIYNGINSAITIGDGARFDYNTARNETGGAIYNGGSFTLGDRTIFNENSAKTKGGAISSVNGKFNIGEYSSFNGNSADIGGAIANTGELTIKNNATFNQNYAGNDGGAIFNNLGSIVIGDNAQFKYNSARKGGAVYNAGVLEIQNGAFFTENTVTEVGGAIYNIGILNLIADTDNIEFTGNTANGKSSAIYDDGGTINLWASENADVVFNDRIESTDNSSELNINKLSDALPTTGKIILNEDMTHYTGTIKFYNGTVELGENGTWFGGNLIVSNSPTINMANSIISEHNFKNLTVNDSLNLIIDADLANAEMDTISATSFGNASGKIKVTEINILSDIDEKETTKLLFANDVLKSKVESVKKARSVLYTYRVKYDNETGYFSFTNVGEGDGEINLGTAASAIAASAGGAATQSLVANQVFANMNGKTSSSKKASIDPSNLYVSAGDQVFDNSGRIERGLWLKPFVAQETVKIGDADVDNNLYGTLAGIDFPVGEDKQVSFYLGYAGSKQEIEDVKSNQTGYVLGATGMIMKDSWYAGLTANVMFNKASIDTDFGTDDVDMNMFSVAAKAGYNFNITNSFVLEPNLTLVYGVVNSQEYESAQGAQIDSQSINNISVEPQVKAKFEIGNGWQPYGLLGYSANLGSKPTVKAEGVELELDSIDGYVEYGAGVNKDFIGTVWSCYAQVTGRSGGRNGFAGNFGIKYKF